MDWYVAKTKALSSCAVTAHLICVFVFAYIHKSGFRIYASVRFSHEAARIKCVSYSDSV